MLASGESSARGVIYGPGGHRVLDLSWNIGITNNNRKKPMLCAKAYN